MCGIAGIIGEGWTRDRLETMVAVQHHRGPDDRGVYINAAGTAGLGHNRLSIIDLSDAGHQPMCDSSGTRWIVFNGEIYNFLELRKELGGYPFRSRSDTEVILAAYDRWGDDCLKRFIGMFAFAIWDERKQRLFCARDRLGIKPFHYAEKNDILLFGSEIKALLAAGLPAQPNKGLWADYLVHGYYDHSEQTFFDGVRSLPPGHLMIYEAGKLTKRCYWDLADESAQPLEIEDKSASEQLRELMEDAVRLRLRSDVPLGVNLSGGLDSAGLMATVDQLMRSEGEVQTFTACFDDPRYDEEDFAAVVVKQTCWVRNIQRLDPEAVWPMIKKAVWHQEAPFGGIATLAYHHLHEHARELGVTVLLEGQGVDEMLAGYAYFRPQYGLDLLEAGRWRDLRRELRAESGNGSSGLLALRRLRKGRQEPVYQDGTSHLRPEAVDRDFMSQASDDISFPRPFRQHLTNALYRDIRYTKLPRVLRMNDRLSMAFSRELREPYLDHRIVEFLFRLPGEKKIRNGQNKFLLRHAMAGRLDDKVRWTPKRAVVTPQREWLRGPLRQQVESIITSKRFAQRGFFDVKKVRSLFENYCQGEGDNAFFIWQWLNAEFWFRQFIDTPHPLS